MKAIEAIKKLQEIVAIDPDADLEFEVMHPAFDGDRETFHEATLTKSEQDSEEDRYAARKKGHPILRATFEVSE